MATWIVHMRIADILLDEIKNLTSTEYVVGNIAPDSGVPNEDWSVFTPSSDVSHFMTYDNDGIKLININEYVNSFYSLEQRKQYDTKQKSFYLGYLTHLLTDMMWADYIVRPSKEKFRALFDKDNTGWVWTLKKDWYDLDFLYLKNNPDFRAFLVYKNAIEFYNDYIDYFSTDAFDKKREYITGFYGEERADLDREYPYLNEKEMDQFVDICSRQIIRTLKEEYI